MTATPQNGILHQLRRAGLLHDTNGPTDGQLLDCFIAHRDEAAFEVLVRRHGPMVLGVCQRIVGNMEDAEDCFQATFLVLACKAASIVPRTMIGNWLHGVAYHTALKSKAMNHKRQVKERMAAIFKPEAACELWQQLIPLLDRELQELPQKYRLPIVLCDLEGKTRKEVARQLGWAEGTVASRHARAMNLLARRLVRHGLVPTSAILAMVLTQSAISACVTGPIIVATIKAASLFTAGQVAGDEISPQILALTKGTLSAISAAKFKIGAAILCAVAVLAFGGFLLRPVQAVTVATVAPLSTPMKDRDEMKDTPAKAVLKWHFEKDKPFYLKTTTSTEETSTEQNKDTRETKTQTFYFYCTPIENIGDTWTIKQRVDAVVIEWKTGGARRGAMTAFFQELGYTGRTPLRFDSTKSERENPLSAFYKALVGCEFTINLNTKTSTVTKIEGGEEAREKLVKATPQFSERCRTMLMECLGEKSLRYLVECTYSPLPGTEKAIGDKWARKTTLDLGRLIQLENQTTHTYEGKDEKDPTLDKIGLQGSLTIKVTDDPQIKIKGDDQKKKSWGTVYYSAKTGRISSLNTELELEFTLTLLIGDTKDEVKIKEVRKMSIETSDKPQIPAKE